MDLPNPLLIHGINEQNVKRYAAYIRTHGGMLVQVEEGADGGRYHIHFPEGVSILEERHIREAHDPRGGYAQIDIGFADGGYLTWYHTQKVGSNEVHNRININTAEAPV